jgi:Ser/Thr protein kinase RdoA (MazF antagonist)
MAGHHLGKRVAPRYECFRRVGLNGAARAGLRLLGRPRGRCLPLDPRGQPWLLEDSTWKAVLRRLPPLVYPPETSVEHVTWLHRLPSRLVERGFPAPMPLFTFGGASVAVVEGAIWEVLSFLPGRPLLWVPSVPVESAGAMLASLHPASLAISPTNRRPGALPIEACLPLCAKQIALSVQRDLAEGGHASATRCVVHGDGTSANMLVEEGVAQSVTSMIDFTLAHLGPPESDISFALWVTGRTHQAAMTLDTDRVQAFVAGYHSVRQLTQWAIAAVRLYLVGRGPQMLTREERFGSVDEITLNRTRWLQVNRHRLEESVAFALEPRRRP